MSTLDATDRLIVNNLQGGFPICGRPFLTAANSLGIEEAELIRRLQALLERGLLSRFGPLYHAERMGGAVTLVAMQVPAAKVEQVIAALNARPEVAHNYLREHRFNLWFVLAVEDSAEIDPLLTAIERETGFPTYNMPKLEEFYIGLRLEV